jgi:hypothetical protein
MSGGCGGGGGDGGDDDDGDARVVTRSTDRRHEADPDYRWSAGLNGRLLAGFFGRNSAGQAGP